MTDTQIFHPDYREHPFWWEAFTPSGSHEEAVPNYASVAIIGAGYAGLATARELAQHGIDAVVFDAGAPGQGASTRSGGLIMGGDSVKQPLLATPPDARLNADMIRNFDDALTLLETIISSEQINCGWTRSGAFKGAWSSRHLASMHSRVERLNNLSNAGAQVVETNAQRDHIGSDFYHGGMTIEAAGHLHPALYYQGLLNACFNRNILVCSNAPVTALSRRCGEWAVSTPRGTTKAQTVVIATNGYTGELTPNFQRRLLPLGAYIIATEPLDPGLADQLSPRNHALLDSKRISTFFRLWRPEHRLIYGSRMRWRDVTATEMAPLLHASMVERYPDLQGKKITHAWTGNVALTLDERPHIGELDGLHYALGCNGAGVANMTYLGTQLARRIAGAANYHCAFDGTQFPSHPLYNGRSRWMLPIIGNYLQLRDWLDRLWR